MNSKLPHAGTTIFTVMSALAREHQAVNVSQGFPDYEPTAELLELANKYLMGGYNQYAPMPGALALRETISQLVTNCYGAAPDPDKNITITAGATQALYTALATLVHPGDEVIVLEPAYDCYVPAILVHGGVPVFSRLSEPDFSVDWQDVKQKITKRTRAIIVNSPHNPTGAIFSATDLQTLAELVSDYGIYVISDEVYEHMVFDERPHASVHRHAALRDHAIVVSSFGKTVHATGWKIGYICAPEKLTVEIRKIHQFLVFAVNHPLQLALADYLRVPERYKHIHGFYQRKRDLLQRELANSRLKLLPCAGSYFQLVDYRAIANERDTDLAVRLTKENQLATIPLSVFYHDQYDPHLLRICFAKQDATIKKAAEILRGL